ncbi:hypothetical protein B0T11DRAFT_290357 [Plectosphaerella cucumerina]|uniref:Uncharacterized protein n=1 Tax=Plectosphaerella cucumerina TaxID=40658 RepID=A0A8K0TAW2_9PEZI|nr:hypothetical protein B0T11DRAFT_290357 [Plectosphaerella cucumerina]
MFRTRTCDSIGKEWAWAWLADTCRRLALVWHSSQSSDLIISNAYQAMPGPSPARTSARRGGRQSRDIPLHPLPLDAVGSGEHATVGRLSTSVSLDRRGLFESCSSTRATGRQSEGERVGAVEARQGGMEKCRSDNHHRPLWPGRLELRPGRPDGQGRVRFARHGTLAVPLARCCDSIRLFPRGMPWLRGWASEAGSRFRRERGNASAICLSTSKDGVGGDGGIVSAKCVGGQMCFCLPHREMRLHPPACPAL